MRRNQLSISMTTKLDEIEKQILIQQQSYKSEYETKKSEISKHKEKINSKLEKIEEDIAKVGSEWRVARTDRQQDATRRRDEWVKRNGVSRESEARRDQEATG